MKQVSNISIMSFLWDLRFLLETRLAIAGPGVELERGAHSAGKKPQLSNRPRSFSLRYKDLLYDLRMLFRQYLRGIGRGIRPICSRSSHISLAYRNPLYTDSVFSQSNLFPIRGTDLQFRVHGRGTFQRELSMECEGIGT